MYTYGDVTRISKKVISFHDQNHVHESAHEKGRLPGIVEKGPKLCWRHSETELFVTLVKGRMRPIFSNVRVRLSIYKPTSRINEGVGYHA